MLVAALLGALVGALIPVQTSINTRLSRAIGATLPASLVSFAVGTVGLAVLVLVSGAPLPLAATAAAQPWWIWVGGLCGAAFLTLNIVLMPRVGASATVLLPVVGQVVGGLVIDLTGAFGVTERALTVPRIVGTALVVVGAMVVNLGRAAPGAHAPRGRAMAALGLLGVIGGVLGAVQTTVNGRLGAVMASPLSAALVSFAVGAACLVVVNLVSRQRVHRPVGAQWWTWTGGLLGGAFVLVNALAAPVLGTSLTVSIVLLGQTASGLVLDHLGFLGATRRPASPRRVTGALLVLVGVAVVRLWG